MIFYLLINEAAVYLKHGDYFESQYAGEPEKAQAWMKVVAEDGPAARQLGIAIRRWRYPHANRTLEETSLAPREPETEYERAEASAAELRGDVTDYLLLEMQARRRAGRIK